MASPAVIWDETHLFFLGISHASVLISCVGKTMTIFTFFKLSFVLLWTVRKSLSLSQMCVQEKF